MFVQVNDHRQMHKNKNCTTIVSAQKYKRKQKMLFCKKEPLPLCNTITSRQQGNLRQLVQAYGYSSRYSSLDGIQKRSPQQCPVYEVVHEISADVDPS
jgi:hypothetical protein